MLVLCAVHFCVSSCVTLLALSRTAFGWYHPKVFTAARLDFVKLGDADGTIHKFLPVGTRLDTTGKNTNGGVLPQCPTLNVPQYIYQSVCYVNESWGIKVSP